MTAHRHYTFKLDVPCLEGETMESLFTPNCVYIYHAHRVFDPHRTHRHNAAQSPEAGSLHIGS